MKIIERVRRGRNTMRSSWRFAHSRRMVFTMKGHKTLSTIASILLVVLIFASCGTSNQTATSTTTAATTETDETATTAEAEITTEAPIIERDFYQIEQFNTNANYMGVQAGWWGKIVKDKFNLEVNIIAPTVAGTGDELFQTRTAAGNLGDSIVTGRSMIIDCQEAGLVLELSPLIAQSPNIQKLSKAYEAYATMFPDGGVYGIPGRVSSQSATTPAGNGFNPEVAPYLRYDWYLDIGAPEIDGWDGLLDVLDQMLKTHPVSETGAKTYAISAFPDWDGNSVRAAHEMLYMYGYTIGNGYIWMNAADKTTSRITEPEGIYYQNLKWLNKAFAMGIFDPDSATQNWDNIVSKFNDDQNIAFGLWPYLANSVFASNSAFAANSAFAPIDLEARAPYAPVPVKGMLLNSSAYSPYGMDGGAYAIGSGAKYPERIMEWYDWMASPEGILSVYGQVEGVTYEMVGGKPVLTAFGLDSNMDKQAPADMGGGIWVDGACKLNYPLMHRDDPNELLNGSASNTNLWESIITMNANEYSKKWEETYGSDNPLKYFHDNGYLIVTPATDYMAPSEPADIQEIRAQIKEVIQPAGWHMIYAQTEDDFQRIWDEALAKLPDLGIDQLYEWDQQIVDGKLAAIDRISSGG